MLAFRTRSWVYSAIVLAMLVAAGRAVGDDASLDLVCVPSGASNISLAATLRPNGDGPSAVPRELIVKTILLEVHSEPGGFWIQLSQPVLPRMTFDICEILGPAGIDSVDLDAARFFVGGKAIGPGDPEDVDGRCENFPPPSCPSIE